MSCEGTATCNFTIARDYLRTTPRIKGDTTGYTCKGQHAVQGQGQTYITAVPPTIWRGLMAGLAGFNGRFGEV
jgi:hypothetical protein